MSRRTMPYHRRYHGDALQGYRKLTLEERGAYTTILDLIYDEGGPIDDNRRWLAGELNCSLRKVDALLSALLTARKIYITPAGKISNHRCETELENALKISRKRAESASKPRGKTGENAKTSNKVNGRREQMQSISAVIPEPEPIYNNLVTVDEDTEPGEAAYAIDEPEPLERDDADVATKQRENRVTRVPPIPPDKLTGNVRLIDALNGRGSGKGALQDMLQAQRRRRS
ncbi:YdaU family protein [Ciceribacter sp. L1K22]|uniref:YdaU family protein n=1 Tax=Ciceribacter sp. L1K22 TaxID=2820275 RepID=UPI001ABE0192|nr:YdaU family protein [Ciceribacter sp. L1K22]MBO3760371.1 YdaU family protein [Ciceribacter sp. L1K22]